MNDFTLLSYGFTDFFAQQMSALEYRGEDFVPARILATHRERYTLMTPYGEKDGVLKGSIFFHTEAAQDVLYPNTGDFVLVRHNPSGDDIIYQTFERKSKFSRRDGFSGFEQVVAVNFDYVFIITSLNHDFNVSRLERYVANAWQSGGSPVVILTKSDLCPDSTERIAKAEAVAVGIPVIATSVVTGEGIDEITQYFAAGNTIVFLGSSGVGKSSLLNAIAGLELMKVNDIREGDSRGRHTTTHRQLIMLDSGAMIIDTPGMRELSVWEAEEGVDTVFSDLEELMRQCQFVDCKHEKEPGCAVRIAIREGRITEKRLKNYLQMKWEAAFSERKERWKKHLAIKADKARSSKSEKSTKRGVKKELQKEAHRMG